MRHYPRHALPYYRQADVVGFGQWEALTSLLGGWGLGQATASGGGTGDLLAYRRMWDPYVMGVVRALNAAGDAWEARSPAINQSTLSPEAKASPTIWKTVADTLRGYGTSLLSSWNQHAGLSTATILMMSGKILDAEQHVVDKTQNFFVPILKRDAPGIALPPLPSIDVQRSVIATLEGAKLAAAGVLHLVTSAAKVSFENLPQTAVAWLSGGTLAQYPEYNINPYADPSQHPEWDPKKPTLTWGLAALGAVALLLLLKR